MQFRVCVYVPSAKEQGIRLVNGLDIGELGMCVIDIPTEQYINDVETSSAQIFHLAAEYMAKVVKLEIVEIV